MASSSNDQWYPEMSSATSLTHPTRRPLPTFDPARMNVAPPPESAQSVSSSEEQPTEETNPFAGRGRGTTGNPRGRPKGAKNKPKCPDRGIPTGIKKKGRPPGSKNKHSKHNHNAYVYDSDGNLHWLGAQSQQPPMLPVAATKLVTPTPTPTKPQPAYEYPTGYVPAEHLDNSSNDSRFGQATRGQYSNDAPIGTTMTDEGLANTNVAAYPADFMKARPMGYFPPTTSPFAGVGHHQHHDPGEASQYPAPRQSDNVSGNGNGPASNIFPPSQPSFTFTPPAADKSLESLLFPVLQFNMQPRDPNGRPQVTTTEDEHHDLSAQTSAPAGPEDAASDSPSDAAEELRMAYRLRELDMDPDPYGMWGEDTLSAPPATTESDDDEPSRSLRDEWEEAAKEWDDRVKSWGIIP